MVSKPETHLVDYEPKTNTLTIRSKKGRAPGLFDLPRDVRDTIYRHAVDTPSLWDRRHVPGCPIHAQHENAAAELPLFLLHDPTQRLACRRAVMGPARTQCLDRCLRRRATALLRVSRRLADEAGPVFWRTKRLCFASYAAFFELVRGLTDAQCRRITAVSLQSLGDSFYLSFDTMEGGEWWRTCLGRALGRLTGLRDLEAPHAVLRQIWGGGLKLPCLRTCTLLVIVPLPQNDLGTHHPDSVVFYAGFRQATSLAVVACEVHRRDVRGDSAGGSVVKWKGCIACRALLEQLRPVSHELISPPMEYLTPVRPWAYKAVLAYLEKRSPAQPEGAPSYVLPIITHPASGYEYEVTLWGVPDLDAAAREARAAAQQREELLQALKSWEIMRRVPVRSCRYNETGLEEGTKAFRRRRVGAVEKTDESPAPDLESIIRERTQKRERLFQEEQTRASTRAGKSRRRSERELEEQKKSSRTRLGKAVV